MFSKTFLALCSIIVLAGAFEQVNKRQTDSATFTAETATFTATKIFHTVVNTAPFLIDRTTTVVWTQTPSAFPAPSASA